MLNIATPRPLAYVEQRKKTLVWKSYLITEYVDGQKLRDFLRGDITEEKRTNITRQMGELFDKLQKYRITHGDLKHSNILITEKGPVLTDLDSMKSHRCNWTYKLRRAKDMARFKRTTT
jgi:tRNA A-37 threonylcarbamoyl transferase component Bud32